ncbi:MAG: hypothetical protein OEX19_08125 [Gammaproteobacteria bacterium]|nr:hypothetical protein [Gammaproteobacteria bacterium]
MKTIIAILLSLLTTISNASVKENTVYIDTIKPLLYATLDLDGYTIHLSYQRQIANRLSFISNVNSRQLHNFKLNPDVSESRDDDHSVDLGIRYNLLGSSITPYFQLSSKTGYVDSYYDNVETGIEQTKGYYTGVEFSPGLAFNHRDFSSYLHPGISYTTRGLFWGYSIAIGWTFN